MARDDSPFPLGPPGLAIKLSPAGQKEQQANEDFIRKLVEKAEPELPIKVQIKPLITSVPADLLSERVSLASRLDPSYQPTNFEAWYQVDIESEISSHAEGNKFALPKEILHLIHNLQQHQLVENVHALQAGPPPAVNASDDPDSSKQGYLNAAPDGISARYAWQFSGGDGAGANVVDMEQGWNLNHDDLKAANITLISGFNQYYRWHGTSVLGEMLMVDNQILGVGIAPSGHGRVISSIRTAGSITENHPDAILDAVSHMSFGDILLLEAQASDPVGGQYFWPAEIVPSTWEAIRTATALGIVVVQAACNGAYDLDAYVDISGHHIFDRSSADFRDSGAIMVGAATSTSPHSRVPASNYGSRVDAYAWGDSVFTTNTNDAGTDNSGSTTSFVNTSAASPIVTGAAMIVQGLTNANLGYKLSPLQVRRILATNGTASSNPTSDRIGVMPNLRAIIDGSLVNLAPDLYIRDYVGDIGNPTSGLVSASPDIIVLQQPVANPQASFGQGSGTENNASISQDVLSGRDHSIYVRLLNRGGGAANNATTTVYWSEPSTLVTPNLWHQIGIVATPTVPTGRILTASNRLPWAAAAVPPTGHYCFVAVTTTADDPAPDLPTTFPDYVKFVQNNNNVAWRNFNVIAAPPSAGAEFHVFPFRIPGAFDAPRPFAVKTTGSLPRGSKVLLQAPLALTRALGIVLREEQIVKENSVVLPLHAFGDVELGEGLLPVGSLAECELQVQVPPETYKLSGVYEFAVIQEWEGIEVGRVTYHFGPRTQPGKPCHAEGCGCKCHREKC